MGTGVGELAIASLVLGAASTGVQVVQNRKAEKAQKRARREQQNINELKAKRERTALLRKAQRARAQQANLAAVGGIGSSSSFLGSTGSVQSQVAGNLSFLDQVQTSTNAISSSLQQASDAQQLGQTFGAVSTIAQQGATFFAENPGLFGNTDQPETTNTFLGGDSGAQLRF